MNTYKYPRTFHLPWSPGATSDDKMLKSVDHFKGRRVIVTEKMDGENTTMHYSGVHARSLDSGNHVSREWVKAFWGSIRHNFNPWTRICGENLYARHSIGYENLPSYFLAFSLWDQEYCFDWELTQSVLNDFGVSIVPVLYEGDFDQIDWKSLEPKEGQEGYVVRLADGFDLQDFGGSVAKYVRPNHVTTDSHWMHQEIVKNGLKAK